jgi:hypothetical protein
LHMLCHLVDELLLLGELLLDLGYFCVDWFFWQPKGGHRHFALFELTTLNLVESKLGLFFLQVLFY